MLSISFVFIQIILFIRKEIKTEAVSYLLLEAMYYKQCLREGINIKKYLLVESFHEEGDSPPYDLVEKLQVIYFGFRTTNGGIL